MTPRSLIGDTEGIEISLRPSDVSDSLELKQNNFAFIGLKRHSIFDSPVVKKIYISLNVQIRGVEKQCTVISEQITVRS